MNPQVTVAIIAAIASVLTLIGTLAAQYFGYRATDRTLAEQRDELDRTLAEQRTRTLNERFATAAGQLGSDKPPTVRLAGVYAMVGLADDWPENRQTCVDVLCAYLRMPYEPDPGEDAPEPERLAFRASREVRRTVIRVITAHLKDGTAVSWQGHTAIPVNDAHLKDGPAKSWQGLTFDFTGAVFDGGEFSLAKFSGGQVSFEDAEFSAGVVAFRGAVFSGGAVYFNLAKFSGGRVNFGGAKFSGGQVSFENAKFSGGQVSFEDAEFSGSPVDFSDPGDWSFPPKFPWTDTPPPGVKLPRKEDQSRA